MPAMHALSPQPSLHPMANLLSLHPMANLFIRNELDAEYVQHTSSCFGNSPDSTLYISCLNGWLGNLPNLTPIMIHQNRPKFCRDPERSSQQTAKEFALF